MGKEAYFIFISGRAPVLMEMLLLNGGTRAAPTVSDSSVQMAIRTVTEIFERKEGRKEEKMRRDGRS